MALKLNIGDPKSKKTITKELDDDHGKALRGKKIGDKIKGDLIGFSGYEFEVTGGSDSSGFPMRRDVVGSSRRRILTTSAGIGFTSKRKGLRRRRTVAGNTIYPKTAQVNMKVLTHGKAPLADAKPAEEKPAAEQVSEKPAEEKKEAKPEVAEAPKEEAKEEVKEEKTEETKEEVPAEQSEAGSKEGTVEATGKPEEPATEESEKKE